ncbi:hypothetical protein [Kineococcus arenarius]|uniref:hypothetical protein n=1 Tax=Kineococcus sp. SYSU DK007 TaxID=3383128 RepID=UPI003D7DFD3F
MFDVPAAGVVLAASLTIAAVAAGAVALCLVAVLVVALTGLGLAGAVHLAAWVGLRCARLRGRARAVGAPAVHPAPPVLRLPRPRRAPRAEVEQPRQPLSA